MTRQDSVIYIVLMHAKSIHQTTKTMLLRFTEPIDCYQVTDQQSFIRNAELIEV